MPNYCDNYLIIHHDDELMMEKVRLSFDKGCLLNEFIPIPTDLHISQVCIDDEGKTKLKNDIESNIKNFGYKDWYEFAIGEWGTKWDIIKDDREIELCDESLILKFNTAWTAPLKFYEKMIKLGFSITAYYYERGMEFCGMFENGELFHFDDLSIPFPKEIDDIFNITQDLMDNETDDTEIDEEDDNVEEDS
jgi:hypothetical protein